MNCKERKLTKHFARDVFKCTCPNLVTWPCTDTVTCYLLIYYNFSPANLCVCKQIIGMPAGSAFNLYLATWGFNLLTACFPGLGRRWLFQQRCLLQKEGPGGSTVLQLQKTRLWALYMINIHLSQPCHYQHSCFAFNLFIPGFAV